MTSAKIAKHPRRPYFAGDAGRFFDKSQEQNGQTVASDCIIFAHCGHLINPDTGILLIISSYSHAHSVARRLPRDKSGCCLG
jgi:hypothetical protein